MKKKPISKPVKATKVSRPTIILKESKPVKVSKPAIPAKATTVVAKSKHLEIAPPSIATISQDSPEHLARQRAGGYQPFPHWLSEEETASRVVTGREGVSSDSLIANGIHRPTSGEILDLFGGAWGPGFVIPYFNIQGDWIFDNNKPFVRLRRDGLTGPKYLPPRGTSYHPYIPYGLAELTKTNKELVVVEGEIKAICLVEEGIPAIGMAGFSGLLKKGAKAFVPELPPLLASLGIKKIYLLGDNDTSINWLFADAAFKYSTLFHCCSPSIPLLLPRIPLGKAKGIDDMKAAIGSGFSVFWQDITKNAVPVPPVSGPLDKSNKLFKTQRDNLCLDLLEQQLLAIASATQPEPDRTYFYRFVTIGGYLSGIALPRLLDMAKKAQYDVAAIHKGIDLAHKLIDATESAQEIIKQDIKALYKGKVIPAKLSALRSVSSSAETEEAKKEEERKKNLPEVFLPSRLTTEHESSVMLCNALKTSKKFFNTNRALMFLTKLDTIELLDPDKFRTRLSEHVRLSRYTKDKYGNVRVLTGDKAKSEELRMFLLAEAIDYLPPISGIHKYPIFVLSDGKLQCLEQGYNPEAGGRYISNGGVDTTIELAEAVKNLQELIHQCPFHTESDRSRALCALVSPALTIGGILQAHSPAFMFDADVPQTGKGFLAEIIQTVYGEHGALVVQKSGGVGSIDESLATVLLSGVPFIQFDNFRGSFPSAYFEALLTTGNDQTIPVRTFQKAEIQINPKGRVYHFTSNGITLTPDMLSRMCFIRLRYRGATKYKEYQEGDLSAHLIANRDKYLGSVFSIVKAWVEAGMHKTNAEYGNGRFKKWWQIMDWINSYIFNGVSIDDTASKVNNIDHPWISRLAKAICADGKSGNTMTCQEIADICDTKRIYATTARGDTDVDKFLAGKILARNFKKENPQPLTIDGYTIKKSDTRLDRGDKGYRDTSCYIFTSSTEGATPIAGEKNPPEPHEKAAGPLVPSGFSFAPIAEETFASILQASIGGPTYEELVASLAQDDIPAELVLRAIAVLVQEENLFHAERRFFPKASDGWPLVAPKDMGLVSKMNFRDPAKLEKWEAYQLWSKKCLPKDYPRQILFGFTSKPMEISDADFEGFWEPGELGELGELGEDAPHHHEKVPNPRLEKLLALAKSPIPR